MTPTSAITALLLVVSSSAFAPVGAFAPLSPRCSASVTFSKDGVAAPLQAIKDDLNFGLSKTKDDHPLDEGEIKEAIKLLQDIQKGDAASILDLVLSESSADVADDEFPPANVVSTQEHPTETKAPSAMGLRNLATRDVELDESQAKKPLDQVIGFLTDVLDATLTDSDSMPYARYSTPNPQFPHYDLSGMMKMLDGAPPLSYVFSFNKILRLVKRSLRFNVGISLTKNAVERAPTAEEKWKAFFTPSDILGFIPNPLDLVPLPEYTYKHWRKDKEFARQFLNGVNPMMIEVVKDVATQVTPRLQAYFELSPKVDLEKLAAEKRLLKADYAWLKDLEVRPHDAWPAPQNDKDRELFPKLKKEWRYYQSPMILFELSKDRKELDVIGIQLYQQEESAKIYTPFNTDDATWLFVKSCVANCDSQFHEWVVHLGATHLSFEPHIIATHNTLKKAGHPVYDFIAPMTRDTLLLNYAARRTLAADGANSFGDYVTSVGVGQFMQLIDRYWKEYDFFKTSGLEEELESRGFDSSFDIPCYYYRADGLKVWKAYGQFATDFVNEIYKTDTDVANDPVLQEWADETTAKDKAAIKGFPEKFENKSVLVKTLQTMWWMCSAQHAAVNYPQYDYYTYQPNKPLGMRKGFVQFMDETVKGTNWIFEHAFPSVGFTSPNDINPAVETATIANILTLPSKHNIDQLADDFANYKSSYSKFLSNLDVIGKGINKRNQEARKAGEAVYPYLHPSVIPASIDI